MSKESRTAILSALDNALDQAPPSIAHSYRTYDSQLLGKKAKAPDWEKLKKEVEKLRMGFDVARNMNEARQAVIAFVKQNALESAVAWDHKLLVELKLDACLEKSGASLIHYSKEDGDFPNHAARADLGITAADAFFLESATIVVRAGVGCERSTSVVPNAHLALVRADQIYSDVSCLPGLLELWRDAKGTLPSAVHMITGPSSTGDIEMVYVKGVHGPVLVHVIVLDF